MEPQENSEPVAFGVNMSIQGQAAKNNGPLDDADLLQHGIGSPSNDDSNSCSQGNSPAPPFTRGVERTFWQGQQEPPSNYVSPGVTPWLSQEQYADSQYPNFGSHYDAMTNSQPIHAGSNPQDVENGNFNLYEQGPLESQSILDLSLTPGTNAPQQMYSSCGQPMVGGREVQPMQRQDLKPPMFSPRDQIQSLPKMLNYQPNGYVWSGQHVENAIESVPSPVMATLYTHHPGNSYPLGSWEYSRNVEMPVLMQNLSFNGSRFGASWGNLTFDPAKNSSASTAGSDMPYTGYGISSRSNFQADWFPVPMDGIPSNPGNIESVNSQSSYGNEGPNATRAKSFVAEEQHLLKLPPPGGSFGSSVGSSRKPPSSIRRDRKLTLEQRDHAKKVRAIGACQGCHSRKVKCIHVLTEDYHQDEIAPTRMANNLSPVNSTNESTVDQSAGTGSPSDASHNWTSKIPPQQDTPDATSPATELRNKGLLTQNFQEGPSAEDVTKGAYRRMFG